MKRKVIYEAADKTTGLTAQELRDALRNALTFRPIRTAGFGAKFRLLSIEVEETDPGARIEGA